MAATFHTHLLRLARSAGSMVALELLLSHARRHYITRAPLSEVPLISLFIIFIIIRTRSTRSSRLVPILSTIAAAIALTAVEAARVQLGQHGEPLDVGTGRHAARAQDAPSISPTSYLTRAASLPEEEAPRAPVKAAVAGSMPLPGRCSWTLPTPEGGARHGGAARRGKSTAWADFKDLRRSLSHLHFSPSLSPEMRKKSTWWRAWACSLISLGLSFADGLWRLGLRLLGLDLNLEPRPKPMLKMGLLSWAHFYYYYYYC